MRRLPRPRRNPTPSGPLVRALTLLGSLGSLGGALGALAPGEARAAGPPVRAELVGAAAIKVDGLP